MTSTKEKTKEALEQAYFQDVIKMFAVYKSSYITAENVTAKQAALNRFKKGLQTAQTCLQKSLATVDTL